MSALDEQIGGSHYKDCAIQPIEYIQKNNLGYCEGNIVKYVTRYKSKNGVEDLKKAQHYLQLLLDHLEGPQGMGRIVQDRLVPRNLKFSEHDHR